MDQNRFLKIKNLILETEQNGLLFRPQGLSGFSGDRVVGVLQRLARHSEDMNDGCYVEIGVFQGLTLVSVATVLRKNPAFGIDNFEQFDPEKRNREVIRERMKLNNVSNAFLIEQDYEDALENLSEVLGDRTIGVLFIDGPHDYRSQLICLQLGKRFLSDRAVIVVDDTNYRHVRQANRDFLLMQPEFKLLYEAYTVCHPDDMTPEQRAAAVQGWWNGVNIIVRDPEDVLARMLPPTLRDRTLYLNEHLVHANKYAAVAPEALAAVSSALDLRLVTAWKQLQWAREKFRQMDKALFGVYPSRNTYSDKLAPRRFNSGVGA